MVRQVYRVVIACFGGFGRELAGWLKAYQPEAEFVGFIDDSRSQDCLGSIIDHRPIDGVTYLVANGRGGDRLKIADLLESRGAKVGSLVSRTAHLAVTPVDRDQVIILGNASISVNVTLGRQTLVQEFAVLGHDAIVGAGCTLSSFSFLGGGARLGDCVTVHPHVIVLPGVKVGDGAVLGAGSVVVRPVGPGESVFGVPARSIGKRNG
jgi:UDP-3-O-[3-hydroxymyristoyl] glucosamine N-acyltransferase